MSLLLFLFQAQADVYDGFYVPDNSVQRRARGKRDSAYQEITHNAFVELSIGLASVGDYDFTLGGVPGACLSFGGTFSNSGMVYELQLGAAVPSIVTGKIGLGGGDLERNFLLTVRPWPFSIGPQVKIEEFTFSFEIGTAEESSLYAGLIGTVGYRWVF